MNNGKTQHDKLDKVLEITTDIRIKLGVIEERQNNAKDDRIEMKNDIDNLQKRKRLQTWWDGANSTAIVLYALFRGKLPL